MQKIIAIILAVFISYFFPLLAKAQTYFPFPDSNATWNYLKKDKNCINLPEQCTVSCSTLSYDMNGDTVINSKTYHKIFRSNYLCAIREDSLKRVYRIWPLDTERIIFDFSAGIGDTICFESVGIVTDIDSILIDNQYRKRFITGSDTIIEGIGSMHNLIFDIFFYPEFAPSFDMLCYKGNDTLKFTNPVYNTCDTSFSYAILLGINDVFADSVAVKVLPNPTTGLITVTGLPAEPARITVYNVLGELVYDKQLNGSNEPSVNLSVLPTGLYFIQLQYGGMIIRKKVIKR